MENRATTAGVTSRKWGAVKNVSTCLRARYFTEVEGHCVLDTDLDGRGGITSPLHDKPIHKYVPITAELLTAAQTPKDASDLFPQAVVKADRKIGPAGEAVPKGKIKHLLNRKITQVKSASGSLPRLGRKDQEIKTFTETFSSGPKEKHAPTVVRCTGELVTKGDMIHGQQKITLHRRLCGAGFRVRSSSSPTAKGPNPLWRSWQPGRRFPPARASAASPMTSSPTYPLPGRMGWYFVGGPSKVFYPPFTSFCNQKPPQSGMAPSSNIMADRLPNYRLSRRATVRR